MKQPRIEQLLRVVAGEIDYPETPMLSVGVAIRIGHDPLSPIPRSRPRWLRVATAVAVFLVVVASALVFSPTARRAAADLLGIVGIRITVGPDGPAPRALHAHDSALDLGERIDISADGRAVDFPVRTLPAGELGGRPAAYLDRTVGDSGMVSLVYPADATNHAEVEVLITQFEASVEEGFFKKGSATDGRVRFTEVRGVPAYWMSGEPHAFYYVDDTGYRKESLRLAGNVLLWEEAGIAYRIEGAPSRTRALELAHALR